MNTIVFITLKIPGKVTLTSHINDPQMRKLLFFFYFILYLFNIEENIYDFLIRSLFLCSLTLFLLQEKYFRLNLYFSHVIWYFT